jgi:hypothetical protein
MHMGVWQYESYKNRENGQHLNILEKYHKYKMRKDGLHMNST